jgi:hypothetical protein
MGPKMMIAAESSAKDNPGIEILGQKKIKILTHHKNVAGKKYSKEETQKCVIKEI